MSYGAAEIEHDLFVFLTQMPGVKQSDVIRREDYLFSFAHFGVIPTPCVLEFKPERRILIAYAGGQRYPFPKEVREHINLSFPESSYRLERGGPGDGFHFWSRITEQDIRKSVQLNMAP